VKRIAVVLFLALLGLSACQSLSEKRQAILLQDTLRQYEAVVRWGDLAQARGFGGSGVDSTAQPVRSDLRITSYEVVQGPSMVDEHLALQTVAIQYVFESTQQVRQIIDQQQWRFDPASESWSRQSPFPEFR
jgi:hypothetical protein